MWPRTQSRDDAWQQISHLLDASSTLHGLVHLRKAIPRHFCLPVEGGLKFKTVFTEMTRVLMADYSRGLPRPKRCEVITVIGGLDFRLGVNNLGVVLSRTTRKRGGGIGFGQAS